MGSDPNAYPRDHRLTNVSSVDYLANLQYLDVSHNQIDSVNGKVGFDPVVRPHAKPSL